MKTAESFAARFGGATARLLACALVVATVCGCGADAATSEAGSLGRRAEKLEVSIEAEKDTTVRTDVDLRRNDNYGCESAMSVGSGRGGGGMPVGAADAMRALLQFDLSSLSGPIATATLQLTIAGYDGDGTSDQFQVDVHRLVEPWVEGDGQESTPIFDGCVHTDPAAGVAWVGDGDGGDANNQTQPTFAPDAIGSAGVDKAADPVGSVVEIDVTALVVAWSAGDADNHGLVLRDVTEAGVFRGVLFFTGEDPDGRGPRLIVESTEASTCTPGDREYCSRNGQCGEGGASWACDSDWWNGPRCATPKSSCPGYGGAGADWSNEVCGGRGTCVAPDQCECASGFTGQACDFDEAGEPVGPAAPKPPALPALTHDNWDRDGSCVLTWNLWWGENATSWQLFQDDSLVDQGDLIAATPNHQRASSALANRPLGEYTYQVVLANEGGRTAGPTITVVVDAVVPPPEPPADPSPTAPAIPTVSHDNWDGDDSYVVSWNLWWGTNATSWQLFEDDVLVDQGTLTDAGPSAQSASSALDGRAPGSHSYHVVLSNEVGSTSSAPIEVSVGATQSPVPGPDPTPASAAPGAVSLANDNWDQAGTYTVSWNMWWGENATNWQLLEDGLPVAGGPVVAQTPQHQTGSAFFSEVAAGVHTYRVVLTNVFRDTSSAPMQVFVDP